VTLTFDLSNLLSYSLVTLVQRHVFNGRSFYLENIEGTGRTDRRRGATLNTVIVCGTTVLLSLLKDWS